MLRRARSALDHGTGGGEMLAGLGVVPLLLVATEAYLPNVRVAGGRLRPLGAQVVHVHGGTHDSRGPEPATRRMPFRDGWLDAFLCRNGAFCPAEAFRLLRPGGELCFQAGLVGPRRPGERTLREWLATDFDPGWGAWDVRGTVLAAGFELDDYREQLLRIRYLDIAGVVFALRMVPWTVGPFRLEEHEERLRELHSTIEREGALVTAGSAVFVRGTKPLN